MKWSELGIIFVLILINGFFAASELALVSARKARLKMRADRGEVGARMALQLLDDPTKLLSSVQIGITLVGILTGVYSGAVFAEDLAVVLRKIPSIVEYADELSFGIVVVCVTYLSLIFGELAPKRLALAHAERFAVFVAIPMFWVARIAAPLVWLLQVSTEAVAKLLPITSAPQASITEDEIKSLIATGTREGVFHHREREMIEGVLRLADRSVASIMVPRADIVWLDSNEPQGALWAQARASGHSRFLLCDGDLKHLIGVVTLADLGEALRLGKLDPKQHVRKPMEVPNSISALKLLEMFRSATVHLAVVTEEYGDILGVVTPVDILQAIAGELPDEGSRERSEAVQREDGSWLMDGLLSIHEGETLLGRNDLTQGDNYHTVAGFVLWHLGRLPVAGESLVWRDLRFEVIDMDGQRIDKVLISSAKLSTTGESSSGGP
jgi:putative hemolysin